MPEKFKKNKYLEREEREAAEQAAEEKAAAARGEKIERYSYIKSVNSKEKTKRVNFLCSPSLWTQFTAACKLYGMNNSNCLNQLMAKFVKENEEK